MSAMARNSNPGVSTAGELAHALELVDRSLAAARLPADARALARSHAEKLAAAYRVSASSLSVVQLSYAAELLAVTAVDLAADPELAARLIGQLEAVADLPRMALGRELIRTGRLLELPVDLAIETGLTLLRVLCGARSVALWTLRGEHELGLVSSGGETVGSSRDGRALALRVLSEEFPAGRAATEGAMSALRIEGVRLPAAALLVEEPDIDSSSSQVLLSATAPILAALLDRRALSREHTEPDAVLGAVERRLARLRFDLHDGPQQDVHLLAQDLALFRQQLRPMVSGDPNADRALGRLDDLEAQLVALDGDLRRLSSAVQSPLLEPGSLPDALHALTDAFATRTGIEPEISFSGGPHRLTDSQQIALLSLVRESLSNIRQHSEAREVRIAVEVGEQGIQVEIRDDGRGFDPETTLVRAAQAGRLGLVGMHERVRMLGGHTRIDSRPGGPTVICATLPPWPDDPPTE
jgi:signal transduction histidine kinase